MKKVLTHILALVLASIFLVSFTGIRLLIHHCLSCDTTDIALMGLGVDATTSMHQRHAREATCHIVPGEDTTASCELPVCGTDFPLVAKLSLEAVPGSCCDTGHDGYAYCGDCCQTEVHYLKTEYEVPREKVENRIQPVQLALAITTLFHVVDQPDTPLALHRITPDRAPPKPVGRDFVIYAQHLKIPSHFSV